MPWVDPNDPNYVSDEDTENVGDNHEGKGAKASKATTLKTMVPEMSEEDVTKAVQPLILEYFENNDTNEVLYTLQVRIRMHQSFANRGFRDTKPCDRNIN